MWQVWHDNHKPLFFVGQSGLTRQCVDLLSLERPCEQITFEDLQQQSLAWIQQRQFICVSGDLLFKQQVVALLDSQSADFFSLVGRNNAIHPDFKIGRGTFVNEYNDLLGESTIGDHAILSCFCQIGRSVTIGDFCHVSSYCYLNNCSIGPGTALGLRTSVIGPVQGPALVIADECNFMMGSVITKDIDQPGTYYGNRRVTAESRGENRLV